MDPTSPAITELQRVTHALRSSEERLELVLDGTSTGLWEWEVGSDVIRWSANVGPLFGRERGFNPADYAAYIALVHPDDREGLAQDVQRAVQHREDYVREFRAVWKDGSVHWLQSRAHVLMGETDDPAAVIGLIADITERKRRELAADYLAEASGVLSESLAESETLRRLADLAVPALADWCAVHLATEEGPAQMHVAHEDPARLAWAMELQERYPPDPDDATGALEVMRTGRSELYPVIPDELLAAAARDDEHLRILRELQLRSMMVVPLVARGATLGAMTFVYADSKREYGTDDLVLAEELGRRAGLAISNVRLYQQAQQTAHTLQRSLLPAAAPALEGFDVAVRYLPGMAGTEVGGDWYDVVPLRDGRVAVVVGDVMGRGIEAASLMGRLRTALRAYAYFQDGPAAALDQLRAYLEVEETIDFATLVVLFVDPVDGRVQMCSAGHPPPLLVGDTEATVVQHAQNPPLSPLDHVARQSEFEMLSGSTLLLYTDGLVERRDLPLDVGIARLANIAGAAPRDPEPLLDAVVGELLPAGTHNDDVALLALRRR